MRKTLIALGLLSVSSVASAHIHLSFPTSRTALPTGDQKEQHCGVPGWNRAAHPELVSTFAPGATIHVTWMETINHPGWFRIAFQPAGEIFGLPPVSNGPDGNGLAANYPTENRTGMTDAANNSIVLADRIADGTLGLDVTLPSMECTNCTLQFIQVMTDKKPYTVDLASDDIYFNCADIVLSASAPDAGATGPDAGGNPGGPDGGGGGGSAPSGGCSTSGGAAGLPLGLALIGLVARRRRRS